MISSLQLKINDPESVCQFPRQRCTFLAGAPFRPKEPERGPIILTGCTGKLFDSSSSATFWACAKAGTGWALWMEEWENPHCPWEACSLVGWWERHGAGTTQEYGPGCDEDSRSPGRPTCLRVCVWGAVWQKIKTTGWYPREAWSLRQWVSGNCSSKSTWDSGPGPPKDSHALTSFGAFRCSASLSRVCSPPLPSWKPLLRHEVRRWHSHSSTGPGAGSSTVSNTVITPAGNTFCWDQHSPNTLDPPWADNRAHASLPSAQHSLASKVLRESLLQWLREDSTLLAERGLSCRPSSRKKPDTLRYNSFSGAHQRAEHNSRVTRSRRKDSTWCWSPLVEGRHLPQKAGRS